MTRNNWINIPLISYLIFFIFASIILTEGNRYLDTMYYVLLVFFTGIYDPNITQDASQLVVFISITGVVTEIFLLIIVTTLILRYIYEKQSRIRRFFSHFTLDIPFRQILIALFVSISIIATVVFKIVEDTSWLNAIYYTVVTITTVGYGDLVATQPITKITTILLIISGITFLGLASQFLIDRIVKTQLEMKLNLPLNPLNYDNHIIIAGYGSKGSKLAQLFIDRRYKVIIVEKDAKRSIQQQNTQLEFITGDITKPVILKILSLRRAAGLFLLLSNDDQTIQSGILARSMAPKLDIFGEFSSVATYKISRYAGINRPISLFHYLLNVINANLRQQDIIFLDRISDLKSYESKLGYVLVPMSFDYKTTFSSPIEIGYVNVNLNEFSPYTHPIDIEEFDTIGEKRSLAMRDKTHLLLGIEKEELFQINKIDPGEKVSFKYKRVIFTGYPDFADEFIERLGIGSENTIILWQDSKEKELLNSKEYTNYEWSINDGIGLIERLVKDGDLIICTFDDITSSLLVGITVNNLDKDTHLIQMVPYEYDIEPHIQIGAEAVVTPQRIISDAMLSSFMQTNHESPSFVFTDGHIYEYLTYENDSFDGKRVSELLQEGISVLYINKARESGFIEALLHDRIEKNDRLVVYIDSQSVNSTGE